MASPVAAEPTVTAGSYLCLPYRWNAGTPEAVSAKNEKILQHCSTLANLFPLPLSEDERKVMVAQTLTNAENYTWEVWRTKPLEFVGLLLLTRVAPKLDAYAHFAFFDRQLVGKRPLVQTMLRWCFQQLELRRITVEIPEHLSPLIRFARKLGFRYEGEADASQHPITVKLGKLGVNAAGEWIAKWGSRREQMHFDSTSGQWRAVISLRLLREEAGVT